MSDHDSDAPTPPERDIDQPQRPEPLESAMDAPERPEPDTVAPGLAGSTRVADPTSSVFADWRPPQHGLERALVLAGGGATGIAWEAGIVIGLRDEGVDVRTADTMIGTSAGSIVAAHLRLGTDEDGALTRIREGAPLSSYGRLGASDAGRYVRSQLTADRRGGRSVVSQAALEASTPSEEEWLETAGLGLVGKEWPPGRLFVTAVDAETGTSVVFDGTGGVPLERAVAASCAVPGVFPAVEVAGRRYVDGGLRTIANADLAAGHARVLVLSPYPVGPRMRDLPRMQLRALRPHSRTHLVVPDAKDLWAMGANPLDMTRGAETFESARAHGRRIAARVAEVWDG
ncbi:patatin-like phospholipase family protein [Phycicoccus endophyticus]|uniref:Patatin-like phospholipase family protein n=1 Tax=Phycicoccus endophyticus TaxID=1690220 RepID=A0A7G9R572_9MICO|nr:patatin-like phospholipase family protein [Phycicoccus endophyticus]NHI20650.1 patatin-like phospholipase family protein [Phycicoccus endophyticus]QNN50747.1 patatin-like phospholipase family protein [Phycicoccus endophyticus]